MSILDDPVKTQEYNDDKAKNVTVHVEERKELRKRARELTERIDVERERLSETEYGRALKRRKLEKEEAEEAAMQAALEQEEAEAAAAAELEDSKKGWIAQLAERKDREGPEFKLYEEIERILSKPAYITAIDDEVKSYSIVGRHNLHITGHIFRYQIEGKFWVRWLYQDNEFCQYSKHAEYPKDCDVKGTEYGDTWGVGDYGSVDETELETFMGEPEWARLACVMHVRRMYECS